MYEPSISRISSILHRASVLKIYRFDFMADEIFTDRRIYTACKHANATLLWPKQDNQSASSDAINSLSLQRPHAHWLSFSDMKYIYIRMKSEIRR